MDYIQPDWKAPANIKAYTTLRHAWGRDKASRDDSLTRQQLSSLLDLPSDPIWLNQTHSTIALEALPENKDRIADASYSALPGQVCIVTTADCLPILICNKQGTHVAAIHAGWRGLAGGIIESTLDAMNIPANDLLIWLGPAIGPQKFEVGADVYDAFTNKHSESAAAFIPVSNGKWLANLFELATLRLKLRGVSEISGGRFCTYTQEDLFFSYRRDKGQTGRLASVIWING